jgi:thiol:disulfide interchange protein DsbD
MKLVISFLLFLTTLLSNDGFLSPDKAFDVKFIDDKDKVTIDIKLDKTVYLYEDKLKVLIGKEDVTKLVIKEKPIEYDGFIVFKKSFSIDVSNKLLQEYAKDGSYELSLKYQGCSVEGLCYAPMKKLYKGSIKSTLPKLEMPDLNGGFLSPDKAFKVSFKEYATKVTLSMKLDKSVYIYDDKVKILDGKTDITKDVFTIQPIEYDGFIVHKKSFDVKILKSKLKSNEITFKFQGCSVDGLCYTPMEKKYILSQAPVAQEKTISKTENKTGQKVANEQPQNETDSITGLLNDGNIFLILATFFGFGLLLSLTPCIFPMIPILSSIIVQHSKDNGGEMSAKKGFFLSLVYVLSMAMAYTIAGVLAGLFGANIQAMMQNPVVLVIFSGVFVALAFSLFGYYSLELPQSFQNKINKLSGSGEKKGGIIGIAIMGFLSALIVGPCVAPPLAGALVYIGQTGDAVLGGLALFFMSIGLGAPLLLVGAGAGKYMPKPGGWMETVSKVFGIVMLALAVYMLDRVLDPIVVMLLWAALLVGAGIYLQVFENIISRTIATLVLVYGIMAFVGAISGATNIIKPLEKFTNGAGAVVSTQKLQFTKVKSLEELDAAIKASNKPVMLDFWAEWCVSCKELDSFTFTDPTVIAELSKYTLLKADVTHNTSDDQALMKKFNVFGPPALIFWDKDGNIETNKRIIGYKPPKEFLDIITK